ncbi:D-alanyl-D-alanine carboxypeptidase family protein [Pseudomonas sp. Irchel 3A5]|uniref:D-alanyl-D-alanine carboxypeptidase family protein n=1 Tax=Pseudomonas sp. Irchel 3A5 TaxID=2008911 RepID=UPI000BA38E9A|nr:D-alanyl-D-alanine carboxypeptidase family protein [Pseudomonas sp. Irchel 3A5]
MAAPTPGAMIPSPPQLSASAWVLMDANTGHVIVEHNADERLPPASLTKLMTVYVATRDIQAGQLKPDELVTVSENAWRTEGSRMFIDPGSSVSVHDLLQGIVIDSGNDASVALAEHIAGSTDSFASLMNKTAQSLGLSNTHFDNPTGLPEPDHYSSAHDMAMLAQSIINDESAYYPLYKKKHFTWNGIRQPNRNLLLWRDKTVDGLKTGHTEAAGYCMVTSAVRDGRRLITAVFGSSSALARATDTEKLLTYGFRFYENQTFEKALQPLSRPRVWKGAENTLAVGVLDDITLTTPKGSHKPETRVHIDAPLIAPVEEGAVVGSIDVFDGEQKLATRPLIALEGVEEGGWWTRWTDAVRLLFQGWFAGFAED